MELFSIADIPLEISHGIRRWGPVGENEAKGWIVGVQWGLRKDGALISRVKTVVD